MVIIVSRINVFLLIVLSVLSIKANANCQLSHDVNILESGRYLIRGMAENNLKLTDMILEGDLKQMGGLNFYMWREDEQYRFTLFWPSNGGYEREELNNAIFTCSYDQFIYMLNSYKNTLLNEKHSIEVFIVKNPKEPEFLNRNIPMLACKKEYETLIINITEESARLKLNVGINDCNNSRYAEGVLLWWH